MPSQLPLQSQAWLAHPHGSDIGAFLLLFPVTLLLSWQPLCLPVFSSVWLGGEGQSPRRASSSGLRCSLTYGRGEVISNALGDLEIKGAVPGLKVLVTGQPEKEQMMQRDDEENKRENSAAR